MKNILIISSSRADYHLLQPVAERLGDECEFAKIRCFSAGFISDLFRSVTDGRKVVLLGDRSETCMFAHRTIGKGGIIYHLHGGEETLGSKDNIYRKAITCLSHVHLTAHKKFSDRISKMGEDPKNIFTCGSLGVWRAKQLNRRWYKGRGRLVDLRPLTVILHPNTIEPEKTESEVQTLLDSLKSFTDGFRIKFYEPNYDSGREIIVRKVKAFIELYGGEYIEEESGDDFMNSLANSACIIGNSSCGIIEAPSLRVPTINIGDRQDGRPMANSILCCEFDADRIKFIIDLAIKGTPNFDFTNPYDNTEHDTVEMICDIIKNHPVSFQKRFMD